MNRTNNIQNILVIGVDAAALAASANNAGYNVFAADYFGDQDLKKACKSSLSTITQEPRKSCGHLETNFSPSTLLSLAKKLLRSHQIDAALLASGLEDSPKVLAELNDLIPIIGNHPKIIKKIRSKLNFFHELEKLNIPCPKTAFARNLQEGKRAAKDVGYPILAKPLTSLGGSGIRKAINTSELETVFERVVSSSPEGVLIQEFVSGVDVSVSFLSTKETTGVLTLNEQLLGAKEVGQKEPFGYCGNIVSASADTTFMNPCRDIVKKIAAHFGLVGSNGADFVVSKDNVPYVVEVNPRSQGTLECVERVLAMNLVNAHMKACLKRTLPPFNEGKRTTYCARLILYAHQRSIAPNLSDFEETRDLPFPGVVIEEGEPLCSIVVQEKTRRAALGKAKTLAGRVYGIVKPSF